MAAAAAVNVSTPEEKLSPAEREILQQPYSEAVKFMGYRSDLIVYAVKMLQFQQKVVEVGRIMLEVEKLEKMEKMGEAFPPLPVKSANNKLGSDGESDSDDSGDYADAREPDDFADTQAPDHGDLQTDGERPLIQNKAREVPLPQPKLNEGRVQNGMEMAAPQPKEVQLPELRVKEDRVRNATEITTLHRKLKALRYENQLLKARQMCKSCRHRPVSITFLPCGHYAYCFDCGQKFGACPICRKTILADVRTFLA